jgi:tetratricopeptide (TPR) repeat protein
MELVEFFLGFVARGRFSLYKSPSMKRISSATRNFTLPFLLSLSLAAAGQVKTPRASKMAAVSEQIGITDVTIHYSRPAVNGREGKIWGDLVPYGFFDYHYGTSKAAPWRAGANENTTIEFSTDVNIEGKPLAAGKYGFFIAMGPEKATLIFSKDNNAWGSFYYNPGSDVLRVDVPVIKTSEQVEWLKYDFGAETDSSAVGSLLWEKIKIPFTIGVDLKKTQVDAYRYAFNSGSFYEYWQNMQQAAEFCLVNNVNIEEGLSWADRSINTYFGEANFQTLSTYAGLLRKVGQVRHADSVMKIALPKGSVDDIYTYGSNLEKMNEHQAAWDAYKFNYDKAPGNWLTNFGLSKGYAGLGDKAAALKYADKSLELLQDDNLGAKSYVTRYRQALANGKDVSGF